MNWGAILLFSCGLFIGVCAQNGDICGNKEYCHDCIQEVGCAWCSNPQKNLSNCQPETNVQCDSKAESPKSTMRIISDLPLSSQENRIIQLQPQKLSLRLRKNQPYTIQFQYKQAENYPVDLYYLLDLSASMQKHKNKLSSLGEAISNTMKKLTKNFKLGFGSFVDKPTVPYVDITKQYSDFSARAQPYSFKHHLSLTEDYRNFNQKVEDAKISENIDSPEGGLDALMQAIVCEKEIGWRSDARKLLVFSTDAGFHMAGDGKLGGVVEPNDGQCHLENNEYTKSLKYDYPSVSHINKVATEHSINIVFAVSTKQMLSINKTYHNLAERLPNANVGRLDPKSDNVVRLIQDNYNRIVDSVTMISNAGNDYEIKFSANCAYPKENGCTNVHVGDIINFSATITLRSCKTDAKKEFYIQPRGLNEKIYIQVEPQCTCDCEQQSKRTSDSSCSDNGQFKCGICYCNEGRYGNNCECDGQSQYSDDVSACQIRDNSTICSDQGTCKCNTCVCHQRPNPNERIYGKHCECNNYNCYRVNNMLCGGNGDCDCGTCKCYPGWSGDSCECMQSNATCIAPGESEVCSGHGECTCGRCSCTQDDNKYSGKYCEECISCPSKRCEELRPCVECQAYHSGSLNETQCLLQCTTFQTEKVAEFKKGQDSDYKRCTIVDSDGCRITFQYVYDGDMVVYVEALNEKSCITNANALVWSLGVISTILLAGLLMLLIWKVLTTIYDRREYARFEDERNKLKWHVNQNPLYREVSTTFTNPSFRKNRFSMQSDN